MRYIIILAATLALASSAFARQHEEERDPAPADNAVLAQLVPGTTNYQAVLQLLGPPNATEKTSDGQQLLIYTGSRHTLKQHVGFLFFGWTKESPGAPYRTIITLRNNIVEGLTSN